MTESAPGEIRPKLELSFSSLSVAPTDVSPLSLNRGHVTRQTVENMMQLRDYLSQVVDVSVSLHLGDLTDVSSAARQLAQKGIRITSIDRPDVYPTHLAIKDSLQRLKKEGRHEALITFARRAHNIGSEAGANKKIQQGVEAITAQKTYGNGQRVVLRTHSGLWAQDGGGQGERLRKSLRGTGVVLAVEILASVQTQCEYRELIERLAKDNEWDTKVYYDVDLGHIAESKFIHRERTDGKEPLAFLEEIIAESGQLIAVTSLNQYTDGDHVTHRNFLDPGGKINHQYVARALGKGVRTGKLEPHVLAVAEPMPFEFPQLLSPQGVIFVSDFKRQFEESAGV